MPRGEIILKFRKLKEYTAFHPLNLPILLPSDVGNEVEKQVHIMTG